MVKYFIALDIQEHMKLLFSKGAKSTRELQLLWLHKKKDFRLSLVPKYYNKT